MIAWTWGYLGMHAFGRLQFWVALPTVCRHNACLSMSRGSCDIKIASHVFQYLLHMFQVEIALGTAESTAKVQNLSKIWGMCSNVSLLIPCRGAWSGAAESLWLGNEVPKAQWEL